MAHLYRTFFTVDNIPLHQTYFHGRMFHKKFNIMHILFIPRFIIKIICDNPGT